MLLAKRSHFLRFLLPTRSVCPSFEDERRKKTNLPGWPSRVDEPSPADFEPTFSFLTHHQHHYYGLCRCFTDAAAIQVFFKQISHTTPSESSDNDIYHDYSTLRNILLLQWCTCFRLDKTSHDLTWISARTLPSTASPSWELEYRE